VEALHRYLPEFGVELVDTPDDADLIHCHAGALHDRPGKPLVNSSHGLYWAEYPWDEWADEANAGLALALEVANAHTAPSEWVAAALRRGMLINPKVVSHGVEPDEWLPGDGNGGYVLWNKGRADPVSDPTPVGVLADLLPNVPFTSTLAPPEVETPNLTVTGRLSPASMRALVRHAGVYLATARETFGIGTLEALSSGVPVAGWDYGGQREIVRQGETGYLASFGDYDQLARCIEMCLWERERLAKAARADVLARWRWPDKVAEYAALYEQTLYDYTRPRPRVSVIVPLYNLQDFVAEAVRSVKAQTLGDFECLLVDDCSTDFSGYNAEQAAFPDNRFRLVRTPQNLGLCGARNFGLAQAKGRYITFLDADDLLPPHALATLATTLDNEPGIHIAFGHLDVINEAGSEARRNDWPFGEFSWYGQMAHLNQIPYNALVRREVYERAGGFRRRHKKAEDAWFWAFVTSFGFRAEKVTQASTLIWRSRTGSKSRKEGGDAGWTDEFPWAMAHSAQETLDHLRETGNLPTLHGSTVPWGAQGPRPPGKMWNVWANAEPKRAYLVKANGNADALTDTLDAVLLQEDHDWECAVEGVGAADFPIPGAPWARPWDLRHPGFTAKKICVLQAGELTEGQG